MDYLKEFLSVFFLPEFSEILLLAGGILLYTGIVFYFYKAVSRRDILRLGAHKGILSKILLSLFVQFAVFPILSFLWFFILSTILLLISTAATRQILLSSIAILASIRVSAYVNEELSTEIAKTVPISLLAFFLLNPRLSIITENLPRVYSASLESASILGFLGAVIVLEWLLRAVAFLSVFLFGRKTTSKGQN